MSDFDELRRGTSICLDCRFYSVLGRQAVRNRSGRPDEIIGLRRVPLNGAPTGRRDIFVRGSDLEALGRSFRAVVVRRRLGDADPAVAEPISPGPLDDADARALEAA